MRPVFIVVILLFISCGDKNIQHITNNIENSEIGDVTSDPTSSTSRGDVQLQPMIHAINAAPFINKRFDDRNITDERYSDFSYQRITSENELNHTQFKEGLKFARLSGIKLIIDDGNKFDDYLSNQYDLKELIIDAKEIVINSKIWLPSTNITINAEKLIIGPTGQISTTPSFISDGAKVYTDGKAGANAGNIHLNIAKLEIQGPKRAVFNLVGGKGQDAGLGKDGDDGEDHSNIDQGGGVLYKEIYKYVVIGPRPGQRGGPSTLVKSNGYFKLEKEIGHKVWPSDGEDAIPGGSAGVGGNGGNFISTVSLAKELIINNGGATGKDAPDYIGGSAGKPNPAYHIWWHNDKVNKTTKKEFIDGQPVKSPKATIHFGNIGNVEFIEDSINKYGWITNSYLERAIKYGKDLYLGNYFDEAYEYFSGLAIYCQEIDEDDVERTNLCLSIFTNLQKLKIGHNYFNKQINTVPIIGLEVSTEVYKQELLNSLEIIYYATLDKNKKVSTEERLKLLSQLQDSIYNDLESSNNLIPDLVKQIPALNKEVSQLRGYEETFKKEIDRLQNMIEERARRNVDDRRSKIKFLKAVKSVAAVASVIPIGQPALGIATGALATFIDKGVNATSITESLKNSYSLYKSVKEVNEDMVKSKNNWNEGFKKIKYSTLKAELDKASKVEGKREERKKVLAKYLKDVTDFAKPIVKQTMEEIEDYKKITFPKDEVEKEIQKIQKTDPMFNEVTRIVRELIEKRKLVSEKVRFINSQISDIIIGINEGFNKISKISDEKYLLLNESKYILSQDFKNIIEDAKYRLLSYNYDLYNSYQYRLMSGEKIGFYDSLDTIIKKMEDDIKESEVGSKADLEDYFRMNQRILSQVFRKSVDSLAQDEIINSSFPYYLKEKEIEALNDGKDIYINFFEIKSLFAGKENLKFRNLKIETEYTSYDNGQKVPTFDLVVEHGADHIIEKNGVLYKLAQEKEYSWGVTVNTKSGEHFPKEPSKLNFKFLEALLGKNLTNDEVVPFYARPSVLGEYRVRFINTSIPKTDTKIESVKFTIDYDYMKAN
ncbi:MULTISPECIES: coiled-coil domain-containing protein [unclassified Halobacteriovorax]|uniref:coiled-coil domain-containing protein n=1 Tax=unclassified Halobacteriovorax TaxID=2639665 RepID=UPI00399C28BE